MRTISANYKHVQQMNIQYTDTDYTVYWNLMAYALTYSVEKKQRRNEKKILV